MIFSLSIFIVGNILLSFWKWDEIEKYKISGINKKNSNWFVAYLLLIFTGLKILSSIQYKRGAAEIFLK